jgi:hypothetical protein
LWASAEPETTEPLPGGGKRVSQTDRRGRPIEQKDYNKDGRLTAERKFDRDILKFERTYDRDGKPTTELEKVVVQRIVAGLDGRPTRVRAVASQIERTFYPGTDKTKTVLTGTFDEKDRETSAVLENFDVHGRKTESISDTIVGYDAAGRVTERVFEKRDGNGKLTAGGREKRTYSGPNDRTGTLVEEKFNPATGKWEKVAPPSEKAPSVVTENLSTIAADDRLFANVGPAAFDLRSYLTSVVERRDRLEAAFGYKGKAMATELSGRGGRLKERYYDSWSGWIYLEWDSPRAKVYDPHIAFIQRAIDGRLSPADAARLNARIAEFETIHSTTAQNLEQLLKNFGDGGANILRREEAGDRWYRINASDASDEAKAQARKEHDAAMTAAAAEEKKLTAQGHAIRAALAAAVKNCSFAE